MGGHGARHVPFPVCHDRPHALPHVHHGPTCPAIECWRRAAVSRGMRRPNRFQLALVVSALVAIAGLAAAPAVAEARRNPRPGGVVRYVPPQTPSPTVIVTEPPATVVATPVAAPTPAPAAAEPQTEYRLVETFEGLPSGRTWTDGAVHGQWTDVFNGYGWAGIEGVGDQVLGLSPKAATSAGETHATLVVSNESFQDADISVQMKTVSQLRTGSAANAWETAWLLWNYADNTHFYYLALKPNGLEIGKEDPAYPGNQRFLVTTSTPYPIGHWYTVRIRQAGSTFTVWVDGVQVATFTDWERPYAAGALGLYSEDAYVQFNNITVQ